MVAIVATLLGLAVVFFAAWLLNEHFKKSRDRDTSGSFIGARRIDVTFARVVGLLSVAALGLAGLALTLVTGAEAVTAYFTLLGTIAGYLVGAKTTSATSTERTLDAQGAVVATTETSTPQLG